MVEQLQELTKISLAQLEPQVEYIIRNSITDNNEIEHLLDSLLDCAGMSDDGLLLFKRLCRYYFPINEAATADYVYIYRDLYDSAGEDKSAEESL
jgi:hypothetical protein